MQNMKEYEDIQLGIMRVIPVLRTASKEYQTLEDKIEVERIIRDLERALNLVRHSYYVVQDAIGVASSAIYCDDCGEQLPHDVISCG